MKVCLVTAEYPPMVGGVGDYTERLARELARRGNDVVVMTTASAETGDTPKALRVVPCWDFRTLRLVGNIINREQPDLLHIQYQTAAYGMHPAINLLPRRLRRTHPRIPVITTFHDLREPYLFPKAGPLRHWVTRQLIHHSAGVVATNAEDFTAIGSIVDGRLSPYRKLIPLAPGVPPLGPADDAVRAHVRERWRIPADGYAVGHVGLLNHTKGVEDVLQAVGLLKARGLPVRLVMLGEALGAADPTNRAYQATLLRLAQKLGIALDITWTGYLPPAELSRALQALDCCLLPYTDGASYRRTTLLTALAHGLPVVTTTPNPAAEGPVRAEGAELPHLENEETCLLVPPGDFHALADAAQRTLTDTALRARLQAGGLRLSARFTWDAVADGTLDFYREVASAFQAR